MNTDEKSNSSPMGPSSHQRKKGSRAEHIARSTYEEVESPENGRGLCNSTTGIYLEQDKNQLREKVVLDYDF